MRPLRTLDQAYIKRHNIERLLSTLERCQPVSRTELARPQEYPDPRADPLPFHAPNFPSRAILLSETIFRKLPEVSGRKRENYEKRNDTYKCFSNERGFTRRHGRLFRK